MSSIVKPKWSKDASTLCYGKSSEKSIEALRVSARIDGKTISPAAWSLGAKGVAKAQIDGFELVVKLNGSGSISLSVTNKSGKAVRLDRFVFSATRGEDFLATPGPRLRFFREGWAMPSPTGSVRFGEKDFNVSDGYKAFAVSYPAEYNSKDPNKFSGEYVGVLNDSETGASLLLGFISSESHFTRVALELEDAGVKRLEAISHCDNIELPAGATVESEELIVMASFDGYSLLEDFAALWGKRMKAKTWDHTPTGWCSWYYYFEHITEAAMVENIAWLKEHRAEFPLEYIQMDDGYQAALGDWLVCNEKFPKGLPFIAGQAHAAGFKPAIWLAPFMIEERSQFIKDHPEWMVKDKSGSIVWAQDWRGSRVAILDCSIPAACQWLTDIMKALVKMGYEYVKIDFIAQECGVISLGGVYADPTVTRLQALRRGLEAIRKGMGAKRLVMGCTCPLSAEVGIVNVARVGTDITPYWGKLEDAVNRESPRVPHVCRNLIVRRYMHRRLWINDPDTHIARTDSNELTESEVKLWTAAVLLTGGMLMLSDRFSTLIPERAALSKMLIKELDSIDETRPLDFFEREFPSLWLGRKANGELVLAVINYDDKASFKVDLSKAGVKPGSKFTASELWAGASLGQLSSSFDVEVEAHSSKVITLKPA